MAASACWRAPLWYSTLHLRSLLWSALVGWKVRRDVTMNWPPSSACVCTSSSPGWFHVRTGGWGGQEWRTEQDAVCAPVASSSPTDKLMGSGLPATVPTIVGEVVTSRPFLKQRSEAAWLNTCFRDSIRCSHFGPTKADPGKKKKMKQRKEVFEITNVALECHFLYFQHFLFWSGGLCDPDLICDALVRLILVFQFADLIVPDCSFLQWHIHVGEVFGEFVLLIQKRGTVTRRASLWRELYFKSSLQISVVQRRKCK